MLTTHYSMILRLIVPAGAEGKSSGASGTRDSRVQVVEPVSGTPVPAMIDQKTHGQTLDLYFDFKPPAVRDFASFFLSHFQTP
jgi:hypothetical protein